MNKSHNFKICVSIGLFLFVNKNFKIISKVFEKGQIIILVKFVLVENITIFIHNQQTNISQNITKYNKNETYF